MTIGFGKAICLTLNMEVSNPYGSRDWQKIIGSNPTKQEADKKMLQKMK